MKLLYYNKDKPVEAYYTEILEMFANDPRPSLQLQQALMMVEFIRGCEKRGIGFDKSVGTSHTDLMFAAIDRSTKGGVSVSAWNGIYTIQYDLVTNTPWVGAETVEGQADTLEVAISLLQSAFDHAFIAMTHQQRRQAMIAWATRSDVHDEITSGTPHTLRMFRKSLETVPWQASPARLFFEQKTLAGQDIVAKIGAMMTDFIEYVETHDVILPSSVYVEEDALVFAADEHQRTGVRLSALHDSYVISHTLPSHVAPWAGAVVKGIVRGVINAAYVLEHACQYDASTSKG
jgi:hypothetical protein